MYINVAKVGSNNKNLGMRMPTVDSRGRFVLEGLQPGEYELSLMFQTRPSTPAPGAPPSISKNVSRLSRSPWQRITDHYALAELE